MVFSSPPFYNYTSKIQALCRNRTPADAFSFYRLVRLKGLPSDAFASTFLLNSCTVSLFLSEGSQIHAGILRDGHMADRHLLTSLMHLYSACRRFREARAIFMEIPLPDVVTWNVLIGVYIHNRCNVDALTLFDVMQGPEWGTRPDEVTCVLLLQVAAKLRTLSFGERIHAYARKRRLDGHTVLCNALLAMYSRCGHIDRAHEVFESMAERNVVSWSTMIFGLAADGRGGDAVSAFWRMQAAGISPDPQTFTGVLLACTCAGLVVAGLTFLRLMTERFGVQPNVKHYGCVVDLLVRAGRLDQAYRVAVSMPVKPDRKIWRTLLDACGAHRYGDLGERVVQHLVELKAWEAGDHVLLLNMYSLEGKLRDVVEVRREMRERGVDTVPGCTTYELRGRVYEFSACSEPHEGAGKIYEKLEEVLQQLRIGGYVPEIDGGGEGRVHHSEKLAIVFGLMSTPPGTAVRVAKNLRTCSNCHNFAKVFSCVYDREVVVVDRSRNHCFRHGSCSCRDYW